MQKVLETSVATFTWTAVHRPINGNGILYFSAFKAPLSFVWFDDDAGAISAMHGWEERVVKFIAQ
jgi:hypothetical protein